MFWFLGVSAQQFLRNLNASVKVFRWTLSCSCSFTFVWEYNMFLQATMISLVCITWISDKQHLQHMNETQQQYLRTNTCDSIRFWTAVENASSNVYSSQKSYLLLFTMAQDLSFSKTALISIQDVSDWSSLFAKQASSRRSSSAILG